MNSNLQPILIVFDSTAALVDPARSIILRGLIRRLSSASDVFTEIDPPPLHQRPREQARGTFAVSYDVLQVWSIPTSRHEISDRLLRQPSTALNRFPARVNGLPDLDVGITFEHPQYPSPGANTVLPPSGPVIPSQTTQPTIGTFSFRFLTYLV